MGELTLSCLTPHGKEMKVAAKPAKKSWLVSASSWLANSMHGAHPLPTRESICLEISSSERGGREERHSYLFSGLRTCMPAMATGLRVALEATLRDWVSSLLSCTRETAAGGRTNRSHMHRACQRLMLGSPSYSMTIKMMLYAFKESHPSLGSPGYSLMEQTSERGITMIRTKAVIISSMILQAEEMGWVIPQLKRGENLKSFWAYCQIFQLKSLHPMLITQCKSCSQHWIRWWNHRHHRHLR